MGIVQYRLHITVVSTVENAKTAMGNFAMELQFRNAITVGRF